MPISELILAGLLAIFFILSIPTYHLHIYPSGNGSWFFFQLTNWHWRGFIIRLGNRQLDIFWRQ